MNEDDGIGTFDCTVALGQASDFFSVGLLPQWAFAAFAELQVFSKFSGIWIERVAMECAMYEIGSFRARWREQGGGSGGDVL